MKEQSLTESAVLVKIVKQFFDGSRNQSPGGRKKKDDAIADLRADIAFLKQRLMVLSRPWSGKRQKPALKRPRYKDHNSLRPKVVLTRRLMLAQTPLGGISKR